MLKPDALADLMAADTPHAVFDVREAMKPEELEEFERFDRHRRQRDRNPA